jgi:hypothetical protein
LYNFGIRVLESIFERLLHRTFIFAVLLACIAQVQAQKLYFSNIPRLNNKAVYNRVIGENAGGIYVLRFRDADLRGGFYVERYSHSLDFIESEDFELSKNEKLIRIYTTDSGLHYVVMRKNKEYTAIDLLHTSFKPGQLLGGTEIYRTSKLAAVDKPVMVAFSVNRKSTAIWVAEKDEKNDAAYTCITVNDRAEVKYLHRCITPFESKYAEPSGAAVLNSGQSALIFEFSHEGKRSSDPAQKQHLIITADSALGTRFVGLGDHKYFLSDFEIVPDEFQKQFVIAGFYDYKKSTAAHGMVTLRCSATDTLLHTNFAAFDRKFVSNLIGAKQEEDGQDPENFFIRRMTPKSDGGYLIIAEYFEITQQMETFYLNGVPQTSSKSVYNYNDIILVSVDSAGAVQWRHVINKRQSSFASQAHLHSLGIYICEKSVHLVYNDNSGQNNRVMHVSVEDNGVLEQKIILNPENEYMAIIPLEGKQTGYNRFVTPLLQDRQTVLLQIITQAP